MADLQRQGPIAEGIAPYHALAAAYTQRLIDVVFEIRVFDKGSNDGTGRTQLVFGSRGQFFWLWNKVAGTQVTIAAHGIGMNALDRRFIQYAMGGAIAATDALVWVDLPDMVILASLGQQSRGGGTESGQSGCPETFPQEFSTRQIVRILIFHFSF